MQWNREVLKACSDYADMPALACLKDTGKDRTPRRTSESLQVSFVDCSEMSEHRSSIAEIANLASIRAKGAPMQK